MTDYQRGYEDGMARAATHLQRKALKILLGSEYNDACRIAQILKSEADEILDLRSKVWGAL